MKSMKEQYGSKKGESVFYASMNKGTIKGVEKMKSGGITVEQLAEAISDTDEVKEMDRARAKQVLKTRPKKKIKEYFDKYTNKLAKKMTATEGSFKNGGSIKKPPKTSPKKDSPIFEEKGLREKLKERGPEMMEKYFSEPREKTISLAKGGMTKKDKDFGKGNPTFPGKPSGPPPVKGPASQGIRNYKKGGIAKGCGKVMNDRRKLTKYY